MFSISEQISAVTKTTLANPLAVINALSKTAFGGIEKIIALNMTTAKQSFENSATAARELFSASQRQELFSLSKIQAQPQIEKIVAYGRELAEISAQTQSEFLSTLNQSEEVISVLISKKATKPVASISATPAERKSPEKTEVQSNTQLPLLAEAEVKVAKKPTSKSKAAPVVSKTSNVTSPVEIKTATAKPTPVTKIAAKKPVTLKTSEAKPAVKTPETKSAATKPEIIATPETVTTPASLAEKKSAVKMPFPASPVKKVAKPAFPTVSTRPVYKAKGSAATGAKKPVRQ